MQELAFNAGIKLKDKKIINYKISKGIFILLRYGCKKK